MMFIRPAGFLVLCAFGCSTTPKVRDYQVLPTMDVSSVGYLSLQTRSSDDTPGDPVNLAFIGERAEILAAFARAGWKPATKTTALHLIREVADVAVHHSYSGAPVSHRFLFNRDEDYAFEQQVGGSPKHRHHVRLWQTTIKVRGRPLWAGAATYDKGVLVLKHTHAHEPRIDLEREFIANSLIAAGQASRYERVPGAGTTWLSAKSFQTDGLVDVLLIGKSALAADHMGDPVVD
jgi:hypothetical protein